MLTRLSLPALAAVALVGAYGCSSDEKTNNTNNNSGIPDSGVVADTGVETPDSGTVVMDAGVETDSGVEADSGSGPACTEDALSPNHTAGEATTLAVGDTQTNLQICGGVDDFFRLTLTEGQRVAVEVTFTHADGDIDVEVFGPADPTTPINGAASANDNEQVSIEAETAGDYIVRVYGYDGAENSYGIAAVAGCLVDADCTAPQLCDRTSNSCFDYAEPSCGADGANDPNGTDSQAVALDLSSGAANVTGLATCEGDLDFFSFTADNGDSFSFTLTPAATMDGVAFILMDAEGALYGQANVSPDTVNVPHLAAGTWYIIVFGGQGMEEAYSLDVTKTAGPCMGNSDCADSVIGGFCQNGACGPIDGQGMVALGGACDDNADCVMAAGGCDTSAQSSDGWFCNIECTMDADCTAVGTGAYCNEDRGVCDLPCNGDSTLCFQGGYCAMTSNECVSGTCNYAGSCDATGLECQWVAGSIQGNCQTPVTPTCGQGGAGEPNDYVSQATPVTMMGGSGTVMGSICNEDSDIYSFTVTEPSNVEVAVTWAGMADIDWVVFPDADTRASGLGFGTEAQSETATAQFLAPGNYFLVVGPYEVSTTPDMDYSVTITMTAATCGAMDCLGTQPLRQECDMSGACVDFNGMGAVALGGNCDDDADCVPESDLCFVGQTSVFNHMCSIFCTSDAECEAAIPGSVCFDLGGGVGGCGMQ